MDKVCTVTFGNGMGHTTSGASLFAVAASAIEWAEVDCRCFGSARKIPDGEILRVRLVGGDVYLVRAGRIREWLKGGGDAKQNVKVTF